MFLQFKSDFVSSRIFPIVLFVVFIFLISFSKLKGQVYQYHVDPSFNSGQLFGQYPYVDEIYDLYLHDDGRVVGAGAFEFQSHFLQGLGRVWPDGSIDETFNTQYGGFPYDITYVP